MAERVYPSAKPNPNPPHPPGAAASSSGGPPHPSFPPAKSQLYNRPLYRPQPPPAKSRRTRRGWCRSFCCWLALILISLILLAALAAGIFYILYQPQRPNFSVSSLQLSTLNVSASNEVTSKLNLAVSARNPNKKIAFLYDLISISVMSDGVDLGDGSFPAFVHEKKNTTVMRATVKSSVRGVDPSAAGSLKKSSVYLVIDLETKAGVKVGGLKTKKMGIRVHCEGIRVDVPKGRKPPTPLVTPDARCKVKLRIKIWKWTV